MRYLLDELTAYEEGFSDILMADSAFERHELFMGVSDLDTAVMKKDLQLLESNLITKFTAFLSLASPPCTPTSVRILASPTGMFVLSRLVNH